MSGSDTATEEAWWLHGVHVVHPATHEVVLLPWEELERAGLITGQGREQLLAKFVREREERHRQLAWIAQQPEAEQQLLFQQWQQHQDQLLQQDLRQIHQNLRRQQAELQQQRQQQRQQEEQQALQRLRQRLDPWQRVDPRRWLDPSWWLDVWRWLQLDQWQRRQLERFLLPDPAKEPRRQHKQAAQRVRRGQNVGDVDRQRRQDGQPKMEHNQPSSSGSCSRQAAAPALEPQGQQAGQRGQSGQEQQHPHPLPLEQSQQEQQLLPPQPPPQQGQQQQQQQAQQPKPQRQQPSPPQHQRRWVQPSARPRPRAGAPWYVGRLYLTVAACLMVTAVAWVTRIAIEDSFMARRSSFVERHPGAAAEPPTSEPPSYWLAAVGPCLVLWAARRAGHAWAAIWDALKAALCVLCICAAVLSGVARIAAVPAAIIAAIAAAGAATLCAARSFWRQPWQPIAAASSSVAPAQPLNRKQRKQVQKGGQRGQGQQQQQQRGQRRQQQVIATTSGSAQQQEAPHAAEQQQSGASHQRNHPPSASSEQQSDTAAPSSRASPGSNTGDGNPLPVGAASSLRCVSSPDQPAASGSPAAPESPPTVEVADRSGSAAAASQTQPAAVAAGVQADQHSATDASVQQVSQLQQQVQLLRQQLGEARAQLWAAQERRQDALRQLLEDCACCPITQEVLREPVCTADGHCFEREAIEAWMVRQAGQQATVLSPATMLPLASGDLVPIYALRAVVERLQLLLDEPDAV